MHEFRFCAFVSKGAKRIKSTDGRAKGEALTDLYIKKRKRPEEGTRLYQYINKILSINITRLCCLVAEDEPGPVMFDKHVEKSLKGFVNYFIVLCLKSIQ